jgi:hypothetical protein
MQIDMHYYCIYALARLAGLKPEAAKIIATASQYVDDAVAEDIQHHENGNMLAPILTAHHLIEILLRTSPSSGYHSTFSLAIREKISLRDCFAVKTAP